MASTPRRLADCLGGLLDVGRVAVLGPAAVAGAQVPGLGGDQDAGGVGAIRLQRLGDEQLVVPHLASVALVRVGGVDEGDARVECCVNGRDGLGALGAALDGHGHATQADGRDGTVADGALAHGDLQKLLWIPFEHTKE